MPLWLFREISIKKKLKAWVEKYYGEIPQGEPVEKRGSDAMFH